MLQDGRWARKWDCCQECGTTERPHCAKGLCLACYKRKRSKGKNWCIDCGDEIDPRSTRCYSCAAIARREHGDYDGEETRRKLSEAVKAAHARGDFDGVFTTEEYRRRKSEDTKAAWEHGDFESRDNSEAMKAAWARGCFDGAFQSPTSIELQVAAALDICGIEHETQHRPEGYSRPFDEFIPPNTLIEIQGDYWHGPERPKQQKRDAEKARWATDNGYELVAIWEHEIKERGAWAVIAQIFGKKESER